GFSFRQRMGALVSGDEYFYILDQNGSQFIPTLQVPVSYYAFFSPAQYSLGIGLKGEKLLIDLDLTYALWSGFEGPHKETPGTAWKDTWNPKIGFEYKLTDKWRLRAGYSFRPTPALAQTGDTNYLDSDTHVISGGFGYRLGPGELSAYVQYHLMKEQTVGKAGSNPDLRYEGTLWNTGVGYKLTY
ncbi:MAG: TonB-dependent receptor, partial [Smithellaceae bacterium]|nr:TonB-dependent receptor [Smithellaceae bacterium]